MSVLHISNNGEVVRYCAEPETFKRSAAVAVRTVD